MNHSVEVFASVDYEYVSALIAEAARFSIRASASSGLTARLSGHRSDSDQTDELSSAAPEL